MSVRSMSIYPITDLLPKVPDRVPGEGINEVGNKPQAEVHGKVKPDNEQGTPFGFYKRLHSWEENYVIKRLKDERSARIWAAEHGYVLDGEMSEEFYTRIKTFN